MRLKQKMLDEEALRVQEQQLKVQEEAWAKEKELLERQYKMQNERKSIKPKKGTTTTKFYLAFLFINCTVIELFTMWAEYMSLEISREMGTYADFSPLVALIGTGVTEVIGFAVYAAKSKAENTQGGVTYLQAQAEMGQTNSADSEPGSVGDPDAAG